MAAYKVINLDSPIEADYWVDIPVRDPATNKDAVDEEGRILVQRHVTRSVKNKELATINTAVETVNTLKEDYSTFKEEVSTKINSHDSSILTNTNNITTLTDSVANHDLQINALYSKINAIKGIDIDDFKLVTETDIKNIKENYLPLAGGTLTGNVSIQTPNTAVLTLTPKGSSSYASFSTNNDVLDCTTTWGKVFKASKEGKYFYGLADKATADKKGQDVTSYIRSITGANATLTITKGDDTSQSLSINNVLQATKAIQDKNGAQIDTTYFKSANGTFTGVEYFRDVPNSVLSFNGGNTHDGGACLRLFGKNANGAKGIFSLVACTKEDASDAKQLLGTPAGALTWDNKHIVRSINGINANAFGDVAFTQLVTGLITSTYLAGATSAALVSSTAPGGAYVAFTRGASRNGVFCTSTCEDRYEVHYINNEMIKAGQNGVTKTVTLLNEAGNSVFPGIVHGTFSGNLSGTASHATTANSATNANHATSADNATTANSATNANHATTADNATNADTATNADHATTADTANRAYPRNVGGGDINFHWEGKDGQPTWLWGGEDGINMYVYNPATFSVNRAIGANEATNAYNLRATSHNDHFVRSEWDGSYFWTWVRAPDGGYKPVRVERANSAGYADNAGTASRSTNNGSFFINGYEVSVG